MVRLVIIVTVMLSLFALKGVLNAQASLTADVLLSSAKTYLEMGETRQADIILKNLYKTHPEIRSKPSAAMIQSLISEKSQDMPGAIESLKPVESAQTLLRMAALYEMSGQSLAALGRMKQLQNKYPHHLNSEWAQLTNAYIALSLDQLDAAEEALMTPGSQQDPSASRVRNFLRGVTAFKKGEYKEARACLDLVTLEKADAFAPAVHSLRALSAAMEGNDNEAIELCNRSLAALLPGRERTSLLYLRGLAFHHLGQTDLALGDFLVVSQAGDEILSPKAMLSTAQALWMERKLARLGGVFRKDLEGFRQSMKEVAFSPEIMECDLLIAEALFALRRYVEAENAYKALLAGFPSPRLALPMVSGYVSALSAQGKFGEAAEILEQSMVRFGDDRGLLKFGYLNKAKLAWNRERYAEAEETFGRFSEMFRDDPKTPEALYHLGLAQEKKGNAVDAIRTWSELRMAFPSSPYAFRALVRVARAAERSGDTETARKAYALLSSSEESSAAEAAHFQMAKSDLAAQNYPIAIKRLDDFSNRFPASSRMSDVRALLQEAYARVADTEPECLLGLTDEYRSSEHAGEAWFRHGLRAYDRRDFNQAASDFRKVLSDYPASPSALEAMFYAAEADYQAGRFRESLAPFAQFVRGAPGHSLALLAQFHRARAIWKCGYSQDAALMFDAIVKRAPDSAYAVEALRYQDEILKETP